MIWLFHPVVRLFCGTEGLHIQAQLLDQRPADGAPQPVGLPTRSLRDFSKRRTLKKKAATLGLRLTCPAPRKNAIA